MAIPVSGHPTRREVDVRVVLAALVVAALAVPACMRLADLGVFLSDQEIPAWALLVPFALSELFLVRLRVGGKVTAFSVGMAPLCVGFFLVAPLPLLAVQLVGLAIALVVQRDRLPLAAYNLAMFALNGAIAIAVFRGVADPLAPFGWRSWAGAMAAMVVRSALDAILVELLQRFRGERSASGWVTTLAYLGAADAVNVTLALIGLRIIIIDPGAGWLLAGLGVFMVLAYRNYSRLLNAHESLERLYRSTNEVERPRDHRASIQSLLDQTIELLGADTAELTFFPTEQDEATVIVSGRDRMFEQLPQEIANRMAAERIVELAGADSFGEPEAAPVDGFDEAAASQLRRQIITAPLRGPDGLTGAVRVSMNWGDAFTDADRQLLEMFANHASVALHNSKLIDQLRAEVAHREHQAMHDRLTALPNRVMFDLKTRHALDSRGPAEMVGVMLVDLDRFKEVNDTLGHERGDELLEILAERIALLAEGDRVTVARLGGDEFALLVREAMDEIEVERMAEQVKAILEAPVELAGVVVDVGASVGLAVAPRDGTDATTLLQRADVAMYLAKAGHRGVMQYEPGTDPYNARRLSLAADLRKAVEVGAIEAHFQPIVSLRTGRPVALEALARWTHPEFGVVPPDVFIPIAEQSGVIRELTFLILDRSLDQIRRCRTEGRDLSVGVNLSVRSLTDDDLVNRIARHLQRSGVEPGALKLEVTEGTIMADPARAIAVLEDLHRLGVSLAIDDFGMGFSSLNQLKRMPVAQLKIDRSFVSSLPEDRDDAVIVRSVIELGHNLGMEVVAEGVEDRAGLEFLRSLGCDGAQGFFLSAPLPPADLLRWLRRQPVADERAPTAGR